MYVRTYVYVLYVSMYIQVRVHSEFELSTNFFPRLHEALLNTELYVRTYIHMYIRMYVYVHVYVCVCTFMCMYVRTYVRAYYIHTYVHSKENPIWIDWTLPTHVKVPWSENSRHTILKAIIGKTYNKPLLRANLIVMCTHTTHMYTYNCIRFTCMYTHTYTHIHMYCMPAHYIYVNRQMHIHIQIHTYIRMYM